MPRKAKEGEPTFEQAMARLEEIVREMEGGETGLDRMMNDFEEGTALVKLCTAKLNEIEQRIEVLVRKDDAGATAPFAAEPEPPSAGGGTERAGE